MNINQIRKNIQKLLGLAKQVELLKNELFAQLGNIYNQKKDLEIQLSDLRKIVSQLSENINIENLENSNSHFRRNSIPNSDAAVQKLLIETWQSQDREKITSLDIRSSGFRTYSQNNEDGIILRIFSHIGVTNCYVVEIGSNCNDSDIGIPENISTNLLINHNWHGSIFELEVNECSRLRYFFSRTPPTKHFHWLRGHENVFYYSPLIIQAKLTPDSINTEIIKYGIPSEPDLFIIDIDGGDFAVVKALSSSFRPRVIVVEFEKRFRDRWSVYQPDESSFCKEWEQSGSTSLPAWVALFDRKGYALVSISDTGYNAFFIRLDNIKKISTLSARDAFNQHPIYSNMPEEFWLTPDNSWTHIKE